MNSCFAMYRLDTENYEILKAWKKKRGPLFDRHVLKNEICDSIRSWIEEKISNPQTEIVPLPQDSARSLKLGGSPSTVIAEWLSDQTGLPVRERLSKAGLSLRKRQAELDSWSRLQNPMDFQCAERPAGTVILVDDFITTGHTVREAARTLKMSGARDVHVFGLGARAQESVVDGQGVSGSDHTVTRSEKQANLMKGA